MAWRSAAGVVATACLVAAAVGCGSGSTSTSPTSTSSNPTSTTGSAPETGGTGSADGTPKAKTGGSQSPKAKTGGSQSPEGGEGNRQPGVPGTGGLPPNRSLQTFGTEASGRREREVAHAALAFLDALAKPDYVRVCAGITKKDIEEFQRFQDARNEPRQSCATFVPKILPPPGSREKQAANAKVTHVKIKGHDSIVFLAPPAGAVIYLPMIREGGRWRSVPVAPGTRINEIGAG